MSINARVWMFETAVGLLAALALSAQCVWFAVRHPQPVVYDAAGYVELSQRLEWSTGLPLLVGDGFRAYLYPLVLSCCRDAAGDFAVDRVVAAQSAGYVVGLLVLRFLLLPAGVRCTVVFTTVALALPVAVPYCCVVLTDLPGTMALAVGAAATAWSLAGSTVGAPRLLAAALGGVCLGAAVQFRPNAQPAALVCLAMTAAPLATCWFRQTRFLGSAWLGPTAAVVGYVALCLPTMVGNARAGRAPAVTPDLSPLVSYHLCLGLSLDRWSSNPPPVAELQRVAGEWAAKGWSIVRDDPTKPPTVDDFWSEAAKNPKRTWKRMRRHLSNAYAKTELFPYEGRPSPPLAAWLAVANAVVLTVGLLEAVRVVAVRRLRATPLGWFALMQLAAAGLTTATVALVVPEERHTLGVYSGAFLFTAHALWRAGEASPAAARSLRRYADSLAARCASRYWAAPST
ncbi:MAG: hypothetical protein ACRC1K_25355 [Planctomycetia bacterium]